MNEIIKKNYVLITPAKNEECYIEKTILSVTSQSILPQKWVIVSDGSTDRTDKIVKKYEVKYNFIQLLHRVSQEHRNFTSKVYAIREGVNLCNGIGYDFIGNLDADVSFEPNYYECILEKFQNNPKLGIVGGIIFESCGGKWICQLITQSLSVSGPIQMFRKQCYDDIGGYIPLKKGGIDGVAEVMARMHGWEVRTFPNIEVLHHRPTGTATENILFKNFSWGMMHYAHRNHPLFEVAKCIYRIKEKPYILGGLFRLSGYIWAFLRRDHSDIPDDIVEFLRREQLQRLFRLLDKHKQ